MRIYFIGSHATGKSTLARATAQTYKLPFLNEVARTILAEKELKLATLRTNLDIADDYQIKVLERQISEEADYSEFVSDRSFDNMAYMAQHARQLSLVINSAATKQYIESLHKKDVVMFFVRPSRVTMQNDGVRESVDWDQIIAIDAMCKFMLEMWNLPYIQINTDSMQERMKLITSVIGLIQGVAV